MQNQQCIVCRENARISCPSCKNVNYCGHGCLEYHSGQHQCQNGNGTNSRHGNTRNDENLSSRMRQRMSSNQADANVELKNLRFYTNQLVIIIRPVLITILLSVFWVKLTNPYTLYFQTGQQASGRPGFLSSGNSEDSPSSSDNNSSIILFSIIAAQIVGSTIVIALLVKYGKVQYLAGFFGLIVFLILGQFAAGLDKLFVYSMEFCHNGAQWNILESALGTSANIFGSNVVNDGILLPALVTWILLAFLAAWDLFAVLFKYGPLRIMIEAAQANGTELPSALIYTAAVSFMASPGVPPGNPPGNPPLVLDTSSVENLDLQTTRSASRLVQTNLDIELDDFSDRQVGPQNEEEEEERSSGLKLGLGDFVFYSVLVGRASLNDWVTTIGCVFAVISGLILTIFLLVVFKKPLPALPISIAFGILIYFVGYLTLLPMVDSLVINGRTFAPDATLRAGSVGLGFVCL